MIHPQALNAHSFRRAVADLGARDLEFAQVLTRWGEPPFWTQPPGFSGIVISILAQQVSLESANAAFAKLEAALPSVTPEHFLTLSDRALKEIGFSRQKAAYVRGLARAVIAGQFRFEALESMDDAEVCERLVQIKGVGPWTAHAYLLFSLRRADAWPTGDLALIKAVQELKGPAEDADTVAESWRPWRAVAARLLWHHYLCSRGRLPSS
jgi:DNA-3-methyladenine glycosylase II